MTYLAWLVRVGRKEVQIVKGVHYPLRLDVLSLGEGLAFISEGSVHYVVSNLVLDLLIFFLGDEGATE